MQKKKSILCPEFYILQKPFTGHLLTLNVTIYELLLKSSCPFLKGWSEEAFPSGAFLVLKKVFFMPLIQAQEYFRFLPMRVHHFY